MEKTNFLGLNVMEYSDDADIIKVAENFQKIDDFSAEISEKVKEIPESVASKEYVDNKLTLKANQTDLVALETKVDNLPEPDVNKEYVDAKLALKSDATTVAELEQRVDNIPTADVDKEYVDTKLAEKANISTVSALERRIDNIPSADVDKNYVDTELEKKIDKSDAESALSGKANVEDLTSTNNALANAELAINVVSERVDQLIGEVPEGSADEVADARIMISGETAPNLGSAIRTQNLSVVNTVEAIDEKMHVHTIPEDFRPGGIYASTGSTADDPTRGRTFVRYMRRSTVIRSYNNISFLVYEYKNHVDSQSRSDIYSNAFKGAVSKTWETKRIIDHDGFYLIVARKADDSEVVVTQEHALEFCNNVKITYSVPSDCLFEARMESGIPFDYVIPFSSASSYTADDKRYILFNSYQTRVNTTVFAIKPGTRIVMPDGYEMIYRNMLLNFEIVDTTEWASEAIATSECIMLSFRRSDDEKMTMEEIKSLCSNVVIEPPNDIAISQLNAEFGLINSKMYEYTIYNDFRLGGIWGSSGSTADDPTRGRTFVRFMRESTEIRAYNDVDFLVYEYKDHVESQSGSHIYANNFKGRVSKHFETYRKIDHDGFYLIVARKTDNSDIVITQEHALELCNNIRTTYKVLSDCKFANRMDTGIPHDFIIPYAAASAYNMDGKRYMLLNSYKGRAMTPAFGISINTKITMPEGYEVVYRDVNKDFELINSKSWLTECVSVSDTISLMFKKSDDTDFTMEEIEYMCDNIRFSEIRAGGGGGGADVSVRDFGAVGDGVTDDSAAIQAALLSIKETGGTIKFPVGTYIVKDAVKFYSNAVLDFEVGAKLLRGENIKNVIRTYADENTLAYDGVHDVVIKNAIIDCGTGFSQGCAPLSLRHSKRIKIINCTFMHQNSGYHSIECNSSKDVMIDACTFKDIITNSIYGETIQIDEAGTYAEYPFDNVDGAPTNDFTYCENIEIRSCKFYQNSYSPAIGNHNHNTHKNILIHDNVFSNAKSERGTITFEDGTNNVRIYNNIFENCSLGIDLKNESEKNVVYNNAFNNVNTIKMGNGKFRDND